jgi:hypothetical protein
MMSYVCITDFVLIILDLTLTLGPVLSKFEFCLNFKNSRTPWKMSFAVPKTRVKIREKRVRFQPI